MTDNELSKENEEVGDLPLISSFTRVQLKVAYRIAWETFAMTGGNHYLVCEAVKKAFPGYRIHSSLIDRIYIDVQADIVKERTKLRKMLANLGDGFAKLYASRFWS